MRLYVFISMLIGTLFLGGCAKDVSVYNKQASYWYEKMIDAVANNSLEKADGYFSSLQSEHAGSPLLPEATMILAQAHIKANEYLLAEHFLDEYIRRFANAKEREFAEYLKMRAKYMALPLPRRDQHLINEALEIGDTFLKKYPDSPYALGVKTMLVKLTLARVYLNETISNLYERLDKPKAAKFYAEKQPEAWIDWDEVNAPDVSWYREAFEGDGTESWYAAWIPKSTSVIAQDAEGNTKTE